MRITGRHAGAERPWRRDPYRAAGAVILVGAGICMLLGCTLGRGRDGVLTASTRPYEPDIPLPAGFVLTDHSSEDWASGSLRYVRHRYVGVGDLHAVRTFYREQMPLVRWTQVTDQFAGGRVAMRFERAKESCTIAIERERPRRGRRVLVEVTVAPRVGDSRAEAGTPLMPPARDR